ncbi:hypothetical protein PanWU01x14_007930, partial [Parasponia andersonii]
VSGTGAEVVVFRPKGFNKFKPMHAYHIVVYIRDFFEVNDM